MSATFAIVAVIAVTIINLAIVAASSVFAIHGDGTPGEMSLVLVVGSLWVLAFAARSIFTVTKGARGQAVSTSAKAIPYALMVLVLSQFFIPLFN
ncbi:hypothetical protein LRH25_00535 [Ideonella azotifigens]|uniref:Uncharacterized protein n=1 Tax=Ideonella azotifigens TaxID=513160 RepID=A0ABN1KAM1_9BURK|nr:hypothetical protein [Ideonella azotifigens]MCD2338823.1 hypothetical protein [Ideonella azotifigens]